MNISMQLPKMRLRASKKLGVFFLCLVFSSCKEVQKITDIFVPPSERELYARNFEEDNVEYINWQSAFEDAKLDSVSISLPYSERGNFKGNDAQAHQYLIFLAEGRELSVRLKTEIENITVFVDVFQSQKNDPEKALVSTLLNNNSPLFFPVPYAAVYNIVLQSPIGVTTNFLLEFNSRPIYSFPVSQVTDRAIQSFWGAKRDGGRRLHQGVDIFAPRGTPVLAATDGRVSSTGERGLGGKQVWLREGLNGKSQYYGHLDSIAVLPWQQVSRGDTIGFVGSTGNASGTTPHLHFGIYTANGAIDPLPFIQRIKVENTTLPLPPKLGKIASINANIRKGPGTSWEIRETLSKGDTIRILGNTKEWYRISTITGNKGFVHQSLIGKI